MQHLHLLIGKFERRGEAYDLVTNALIAGD